MTKAFVVAKWEYLEKVKSKAFLIGLFITPMLMVVMGVLPGLLATTEDHETKIIGVIDLNGQFLSPLAERLQRFKLPNGEPNYLIQTIAIGNNVNIDEAVQIANGKVLGDEIEGYCIISADPMVDSLVEYRSKHVGDFRIANRIEETMRAIITERRLVQLGLDPSLMTRLRVPLDVKTVKLSKTGEQESGDFMTVFFSAYVPLMMLFFLILTSGQLLVRSMIEEKSNRIVEVLVSSVSPTDLMVGKVLGGLTQIGFWGVIGLALTLNFSIAMFPFGQALLLMVYFVLGYLFYAAIFIGVGSPLTTEQEAQQVTSYLVIIVVMPIALAIPAIQNPNATWIKILSYIPLLTPTMMTLRIPIQVPSVWEIIITISIMLVSIYFAMVAAGRIFRIAILSTGKRPSMREILLWARTG
ncbi:MAG: transporter permease [Bacteroidetes bacterium]|nr:transporter permease [Bacteroidota bacterium]